MRNLKSPSTRYMMYEHICLLGFIRVFVRVCVCEESSDFLPPQSHSALLDSQTGKLLIPLNLLICPLHAHG